MHLWSQNCCVRGKAPPPWCCPDSSVPCSTSDTEQWDVAVLGSTLCTGTARSPNSTGEESSGQLPGARGANLTFREDVQLRKLSLLLICHCWAVFENSLALNHIQGFQASMYCACTKYMCTYYTVCINRSTNIILPLSAGLKG